jgi:hypothetical protein
VGHLEPLVLDFEKGSEHAGNFRRLGERVMWDESCGGMRQHVLVIALPAGSELSFGFCFEHDSDCRQTVIFRWPTGIKTALASPENNS